MAPGATYRLQMRAGFGFREACALVPYLDALGITHLYLSPVFQARKGSTHGYDLTNPLALNPDLGTPEDFDTLAQALAARRMGMILDIVPNHMAATTENPWWFDVLENGQASPYAGFFDIDWDPAQVNLEEKVLLPILGSPFGTALESQAISVHFEDGGFTVRCYDIRLPLAPKSYRHLLEHRLAGFQAEAALRPVVEAVNALPPHNLTDPQARAERYREEERIKRELRDLYYARPEVRAFIDENLRIFNGTPGDPHSFDLLERLLDEQPYQLAYWQVAKEKINYRRFFDITDLVGLRSAEPEVFRATHALLLRLAREEKIAGVRVDHVDGLFDPLGYLDRLRNALPAGSYIVVEKILIGEESMHNEWPVEGTTGYDSLNAVNGIFIDPAGLDALTASYRNVTGRNAAFEDVVYAQKKKVMEDLFTGDMNGLSHHLMLLTGTGRHSRDLSPREVSQALNEVTACLAVYRTYVRGDGVRPEDKAVVERAAAEAEGRNPELAEAIAFVRRVLLLEFPPGLAAAARQSWTQFVMRWQQFTGPIMAKGVEDTAFYLYNPLTSLNEVGGQPRTRTVEEFHRFNSARAARWPLAMNTTSTHDAKRGEDVRARIHVLSEFPDEWARRLRRWIGWTRGPDRNLEVLVYQAVFGAWPTGGADLSEFRERIRNYALKAAREAKSHTSWIRQDAEFEAALAGFVDSILDISANNRFLPDMLKFERKIAPYGALNALAQVVLKIAAPGVPDFYQGSEVWDYRFVDPDNRQAVDFARRIRILDEVKRAGASELLANWADSRVKMWVTWKALEFRRSRLDLFTRGEYIPLEPSGSRAAHVVAFARRHETGWAIAAVPRLTSRLYTRGRPPLRRSWLDTAIPLPPGAPAAWTHVFTGARITGDGTLEMQDVFRDFPVALLSAVAEPDANPLE